MKKITFLVAALFATMAVSATVVTFDAPTIGDQGVTGTGGAVTKTVSGVTLAIDKGYVFNDSKYEVNYVRAYAGATMTISSDANITKIVVTAIEPVSETDDKYSAASFTSTGYTVSGDKTIGTWEGTSTSVSFAAAKQVRMTKVEVTVEDGTPIKQVTIDNSVYATNGTVYAAGEFQIFSVSGQNVTELNGQLNGIYVVKTANGIQKVAVK